MSKKLFAALTVLFAMAASSFADHTGAHLIYDPSTGALTFESDAENATTVELKSTTGDLFVGDKPANHAGLFDVYTSVKSFKLDPAGFASADMGNIGTGNADAFLALEVAGAKVGGGNIHSIGNGLSMQVVPEPSSLVLFGLGIMGLLRIRRK